MKGIGRVARDPIFSLEVLTKSSGGSCNLIISYETSGNVWRRVQTPKLPIPSHGEKSLFFYLVIFLKSLHFPFKKIIVLEDYCIYTRGGNMVQGCDKRPLLLWLLVCNSLLLPLLVSAVSYKPRSWLSGSFSIAFLFPNFFLMR